jgi:Ca2+-binding RTX toxin-like protein
VFLALLVLVPASAMIGFTTANSVATSKASDTARAATADTMKPTPDCSSIALTTKVAGSGTVNGGDPNELVMGAAGVDTMNGGKGNDCILGGGGNDSISGDQGTDVCIGGPGTDTFANDCETKIQ